MKEKYSQRRKDINIRARFVSVQQILRVQSSKQTKLEKKKKQANKVLKKKKNLKF